MSLRLRLTFTYSLLLAFSLAIFGVFLFIVTRENLGAEMDRRLQIRASQVQLTIWPGTQSLRPGDLTSAELDLSPLADLNAPGLYVQVLDRAGDLVATSDSLKGARLPTHPESLVEALAGDSSFNTMSVADEKSVRILSVPVWVDGKVVGVLEVGQSRQPLQETMTRLGIILLILGAVALLLSALAGWVVAYHGLRPLSVISERASEIARRRDFSRRLRLDRRRDEVGRLARTIDDLLATVEDTLRIHREFVADTSHELRNPLLATRTNLELIDRLSDPEDRAECVREARGQVERMSRLIADLLLLARVEARQVIDRQPVSLRDLLEDVRREAEQQAIGQQVRLEAAEDVEILGDEGRLHQALMNLVENALRHTPAEGTVTLRLGRRDDWAYLTVEDTGEGIPPEHLPRLFERFYRVDKTRARASGGSGLGLAIVKHLTEAHGGWVDAQSRPREGSCFAIWLPLRPGQLLPRDHGAADGHFGLLGPRFVDLPARGGHTAGVPSRAAEG